MHHEENSPVHNPITNKVVETVVTSAAIKEIMRLGDDSFAMSDTAAEKETLRFHGKPLRSRAKRPIPKSTKKHFVGELVFNRGDHRQRLGFASLYEHNAALCFIYRQDFLDIEEQLAPLPFVLPNGKASEHFFDFRVTFKGGRRVCISVKPERIAQTYMYRAMMACIRKAAIGNICDDVRTVTERNIEPVELHNAKLFHSARDPEPQIDAYVLKRLRSLEGPIGITDFLTSIGVEGNGFRSVARAIQFGNAKLFSPQKITGRTMIVRGDSI